MSDIPLEESCPDEATTKNADGEHKRVCVHIRISQWAHEMERQDILIHTMSQAERRNIVSRMGLRRKGHEDPLDHDCDTPSTLHLYGGYNNLSWCLCDNT